MHLIHRLPMLVIIVAACASDSRYAAGDSSEWLLETARNMCAASRETLETYLEVRDLNERIRDSNAEAARKADPAVDSEFVRIDSLLAEVSEALPGWLLEDTRALIERLAAENKTPLLVRVSQQDLAFGPVASVGWIEFFYGPVVQTDRELYFLLTIFLLESVERGWGGDLAHYYEDWITDGEASGDLVDFIHSHGRGCEIRSIATY